jgi:restriction endonuclease Mrr
LIQSVANLQSGDESTKRGIHRITQEGLDVVAQNLPEIDRKYLKHIPRYREFMRPTDKEEEEFRSAPSQSPEESFEYSSKNTE